MGQPAPLWSPRFPAKNALTKTVRIGGAGKPGSGGTGCQKCAIMGRNLACPAAAVEPNR